MNISEVSAAGKMAVERDTGTTVIATVLAGVVVTVAMAGMAGMAATAILERDGEDFAVDAEGRCGSLEQAICAM
jgi:hypothetical protein